jgi:hypothetical protein
VQLRELGLDRVVILGAIAGASPDSQRRVQASRETLVGEVFPAVRERLGATVPSA